MKHDHNEVLDQTFLATLATVNQDGTPWATPLHVFSDGQYVYWFSHPDSTHSKNIERADSVSLAIPITNNTTDLLQGLFLNGPAKRVDQDKEMVVSLAAKRLPKIPASFAALTTYRMPIGQLDEDKSTGNCWYYYN